MRKSRADVSVLSHRAISDGGFPRVKTYPCGEQGVIPAQGIAIAIDSFVLTMSSSGGEPPLKLLALGKCIMATISAMPVTNYQTDGGGIRGLSELLILKEVMHRLMVAENTKRESDGQPPLTSLPKPCDYFDLIGGTSTGG